MSKDLTLGSLFSGSGGFELAGMMAGIKPIWNDEVEPFAVRVTEMRLPQVKHYGDISSLKGAELEPVDIITGGFPCQSVSIAGKREGVKHIDHGGDKTTRSGLVYESIRIVKEMRGATNGKYPRYFIAENVKGLFSSNNGEDFRTVLEAFCKIKDPEAYVPMPEKGKWEHAGLILGDGYSIAWRLFDSQHWGVPQRRERVYLVADFAGESAGEILFKPDSMPWHTPEGFRKGEGVAGGIKEGAPEAGGVCVNTPTIALDYHPADSRIGLAKSNISQSLTERMGTRGGNVPLVMESPRAFGICGKNSEGMLSDNPNVGFYEAETSRCLDQGSGSPARNQGGIVVVEKNDGEIYHGTKAGHFTRFRDTPAIETLVETDYKDPPVVCGSFSAGEIYHGSKSDHMTRFTNDMAVGALMGSDYKDPPLICVDPYYIVRRLTPVECARLQGFPDWWLDNLGDEDPSDEEIERWIGIFDEFNAAMGKKTKPKTANQVRKWLKDPYSDSAAYKLWGNCISLPIPFYILSNIADLAP